MLQPEREALREGAELVAALRQACRDTGSPAVPTPVADATRALFEWRDRNIALSEERA